MRASEFRRLSCLYPLRSGFFFISDWTGFLLQENHCICISMITIEETLKIAAEAHNGQKDLDGKPVILHPLAVGLMGKTDAKGGVPA